jgi:hypothetical protein
MLKRDANSENQRVVAELAAKDLQIAELQKGMENAQVKLLSLHNIKFPAKSPSPPTRQISS